MTALATRQGRAAGLIGDAGLAAAAFVPGPNLAYLTGVHLHLMERPTLFVLTRDGAQLAVMPALERLKWSAAMPGAETFYWGRCRWPDGAFGRLAEALGHGRRSGSRGCACARPNMWP